MDHFHIRCVSSLSFFKEELTLFIHNRKNFYFLWLLKCAYKDTGLRKDLLLHRYCGRTQSPRW
jgi:hypothetical protein